MARRRYLIRLPFTGGLAVEQGEALTGGCSGIGLASVRRPAAEDDSGDTRRGLAV